MSRYLSLIEKEHTLLSTVRGIEVWGGGDEKRGRRVGEECNIFQFRCQICEQIFANKSQEDNKFCKILPSQEIFFKSIFTREIPRRKSVLKTTLIFTHCQKG